MSSQKRVALVILDGWGETENSKHNAISKASTPNWDWLKQHATVGTLDASGQSVGLPHSQMGNSEVGHMHIGAGRIVNQDLTRISLACKNKELAQNKILNESVARTLQKKSTIHLIGLLSDGGGAFSPIPPFCPIRVSKRARGTRGLHSPFSRRS